MNIDNWKLYYKTHPTELRPTTTQMCYEPRVSHDEKVFCMNFCYPSDYQLTQPRLSYSKKTVDYMFEREVEYLLKFKNYKWAPEIIDINDKKIFIKWYGHTCNDMIYKTKNLPTSWKSNITKIIIDQCNSGVFKCTMYPHSHYYDNDGNMRTFDFYASVNTDNSFLDYDKIKDLIGTDTNRFAESTQKNLVDVSMIFKSGLLYYSNWPENLTEVYNKVFSNE